MKKNKKIIKEKLVLYIQSVLYLYQLLIKTNNMSEDYKKTRKQINSMSALDIIFEQINYYENKENFNQNDDYIKGKISGLKQAYKLINRKS